MEDLVQCKRLIKFNEKPNNLRIFDLIRKSAMTWCRPPMFTEMKAG